MSNDLAGLRDMAAETSGLRAELRKMDEEVIKLRREVERLHGEAFTRVDNILCRLETQGRPSQAADCGWHEALAAVRASVRKEET